MVTGGAGRKSDHTGPPDPQSGGFLPPEDPAHRAEGDLSATVRDAVGAMSWLKPADQAAVDLALTYAARIDEALATGEGQEVTKALYLGPHLLRTLTELGGTPTGRKALEIREETRGKLADLRSIRPARDEKPKRGKSA